MSADAEKNLDPDDRVKVGACTTKKKRWAGEHGHSFETKIERLEAFTDQKLLNYQVYTAVVHMLWHSGPLAVMCKDHLVVNKDALQGTEAWNLLRFIGFKPCACPEFGLFETAYEDTWCFGNREGTIDTDGGWDDVEEEEDDDGNDDRRNSLTKTGRIQ